MKKIATFLLIVMIIAIAITVIAVINIFTRPQAEIRYTTPYALKFEDKKAIYNSTSTVDYYVSVNDKAKDRHLSAIYSFDMKAGSDFTNDDILESEDTLFFPWPSVKVDQNDLKSALIINEKGRFDWNEELQPIKTALEMMSKDNGRVTLPLSSAEALKKYFEDIDTSHVVDFYLDNNYVPLETFTYSSFGMDINYYPDILVNDLILYQQDSCFTRWGLSFYDCKAEKHIFRISYWPPDLDYSFSKFADWIENNLPYSIQIVDPVNPIGRMIVTDGSKSIAVINGYWFMTEWWDQSCNQSKYLPDILYLLSCMEVSQTSPFSSEYRDWTIYYDNSIEHINSGQFTSAKNDLDEMSRLQNGNISDDEKYLSAVLKTLNVNNDYIPTDNTDFNTIIDGYCDISYNSGSGFVNNQKNRMSFLQSIRNIGDETITTLSSSVEKYYLKRCKCSYQEQNEYISDLIEKGDAIDKQLILKLSTESFHKYLKSVLYHSVKSVQNSNYDRNELDNALQSNVLDSNPNILMIKSCIRKSGDDIEPVNPESYGKSDAKIIEQLQKEGMSIPNIPMVILLYTVQRSGFMRGLDRDAVVFTPTQIYHVPNYDGLTGNISQSFSYEQLEIGSNNEIIVNKKDKFNIVDPYAVEMCMELHSSYLTNDMNNEKVIIIPLGNYIINAANRCLTTVPYKESPITYEFK